MTEQKTKWTRYRLTYHRPGIHYEAIYRKRLETVERLAREKLVHEGYTQPYKAIIEVCHLRESKGRSSWAHVTTITKEEALRDAARAPG